jgi:hypothetical protein
MVAMCTTALNHHVNNGHVQLAALRALHELASAVASETLGNGEGESTRGVTETRQALCSPSTMAAVDAAHGVLGAGGLDGDRVVTRAAKECKGALTRLSGTPSNDSSASSSASPYVSFFG